MTHISATRLGHLQRSREKLLFKLPHVLPELRKGKQTAISIPMAEHCMFFSSFFFLTEPRQVWATASARLRNQNNYHSLLSFPRRYSRVLRGDLATEQGTSGCKRWQQGRCVGGNFIFSSFLLQIIKPMLRPRLVALQTLYSSSLCLRPRVDSRGPQHHLNSLIPPRKLPSASAMITLPSVLPRAAGLPGSLLHPFPL